jgi:zinc transporter 9
MNMHKHRIHGTLSVTLALIGNATITVIKFFGWMMSGSSALFSEAVHSFADTMNQSLLLVGIKRSVRLADEDHTYGYGQERFLWALISACGIFFLGAGVTLYHGITSLSHETEAEISIVIFLILIASFLIESFTLFVAYRELKRSFPRTKFKKILDEGDPTTIAVIYEDGVAVLGVLVAIVAIALTKVTGQSYWDSIGSIIIGLMLGVVAVILINKNRDFLLHKAIPEDIHNGILALLNAEPAIEKVLDFKSTILDVGAYHVKCEIEFNGSHLLKHIQKDLRDQFDEIDGDFEEFKKFSARFIDRIPRLIGEHINTIEERIQKKFPSIIHIDIEIN